MRNQNQQIKFIQGFVCVFLIVVSLQGDLFAQFFQKQILIIQQQPVSETPRINDRAIRMLSQQRVPNLVGHTFHTDTITRILDGSPYVLGNVSSVQNEQKSGLILRQTVRNDLMLDGITPIDVVYAKKNRLVRGILSVLPELVFETQKVDVPSVVNRDFNYFELKEFLENHSLTIGDTIPVIISDRTLVRRGGVGKVISQEPKEGQVVDINSPVDVTFGIREPAAVLEPAADAPETPPLVFPPEIIVVPNYIGLPLEFAERRIPGDSLLMAEPVFRESDEPRGIIISQIPEPGMEVDPFTRLRFTVSNGPPEIQSVQPRVPNLLGRHIEQAAEILREAGLFLDADIGEEFSTEPKGTVLQQDPPPGSDINRGGLVHVFIAVTPETFVIVPDVMHFLSEDALVILQKNGLVGEVKRQDNENIPDNQVFEQFPPPFDTVQIGSPVTLLVARNNDENFLFPPWALYGAGVAAAAIAGGFFARRRIKNGKNRKAAGKKDVKPNLKPVWDPGKQTISENDHGFPKDKIHIKFFPDPGIQAVVKNNQSHN